MSIRLLVSGIFALCALAASGGCRSASPPDATTARAAAEAPQQPLEIHQINVQQGDCTLIIGPNGTTFLIDAGNAGKGIAEVLPYLQSIGLTPARGLDFMLATHRDADHVGGLDEVLAAGYQVRSHIWDNGSTKTGGQIDQFIAAAAAPPAGPVHAMPLGHVVQLGNGATATCVAVGGQVLGHGQVTGATDENDMSVAILVRYGQFEYLTAGDLGGGDDDRTCTGRSTDQANVESALAMSLRAAGGANLLGPDGLEVLDVNHHGSESSTNSQYMNLLSPTVAVINTGPGQGGTWHHPRHDVVEQVLMAGAACITVAPAFVLQTEEGGPTGAATSFAGFCVGDIVIRTTGVGLFQVFATGAVSQGPDERQAAGIGPTGRTFPLDGASATTQLDLVITEIMQDPSSVADSAGEWFEIHNPGAAAVDINGWTIRDAGSDLHIIANGGPLLVPPGDAIVLGRNGDPNQNGGYVASYVYTGMNLANAQDEIILIDRGGRTVDSVAYTQTWPRAAGRSMRLQSATADNSQASNWSLATVREGTFSGTGTDFGSPGDFEL